MNPILITHEFFRYSERKLDPCVFVHEMNAKWILSKFDKNVLINLIILGDSEELPLTPPQLLSGQGEQSITWHP